jgi:hypothetical protein
MHINYDDHHEFGYAVSQLVECKNWVSWTDNIVEIVVLLVVIWTQHFLSTELKNISVCWGQTDWVLDIFLTQMYTLHKMESFIDFYYF